MARNFNGSTDLAVATLAAGPPALNFTVAGWVFPTAVTSGDVLLYAGNSGLNGWGFYRTDTADIIILFGGRVVGVVRPGVPNNQWSHLALTKGATGSAALYYLNGNPNTETTTDPNSPSSVFSINKLATGFSGRIADAAFWDVALTTSEIVALANGARPKNVRPLSLKGYWPLDGLQSPEPDLSGNANNATLTGTAFADGPPATMFTPRRSSNSILAPTAAQIYSFDQVGAHIGRDIEYQVY